ncbi:dienelactone hydrolase [Metarhizium album ARSEF 1941]|uniref:Dienelactone hydrolase n=1 Tax=Metarhizium album (strain ARSEF 1941) TaxID=1081103 RepID=A0A0B2WRN0_METAS|nr:dienelactone hydrolase [Metarhizium album ARSEF 1941]KHN96683.1 dienelactone hydrolase [Metarhizium album ARSEF 1941]
MTEVDVATKAPESDAQGPQTEQTPDIITPAETPVQTGAHCVTDRPTPSGQSSTGEIIKLNDIDVYISKPADYPHAPSKLLLLLSGGTGINSVNNQIQADKFASAGYLVLMPDLFAGDSAPISTAISDDSSSVIGQVKLQAVGVVKSFFIDMWLARITPDKVMPILHKVIEAAQDQYADAIKNGEGIYAVGYCVGGRFILLLAQETEEQGSDEETAALKSGPYIKAGAVAHAASVTPDDFKNLKAPLSFVCVEDDNLFPDDVRKAGEDAMSRADLEHEVQVYPGVPHGFAVVGAYADGAITEAQTTAYEQMLKWINEH